VQAESCPYGFVCPGCRWLHPYAQGGSEREEGARPRLTQRDQERERGLEGRLQRLHLRRRRSAQSLLPLLSTGRDQQSNQPVFVASGVVVARLCHKQSADHLRAVQVDADPPV